MQRCLMIVLVALVAACAKPAEPLPTGERGGRSKVVADFSYSVRQNVISGSYNPQIFEKDRVLGHVRRSCREFAIGQYRETRSTRRVSFTVACRTRANADAIGQWVVERGESGSERARKI